MPNTRILALRQTCPGGARSCNLLHTPGRALSSGHAAGCCRGEKRLTLPIAAAATGQGCLPWLQPTRPDPQVAVATLAKKAARFIIAYVHYTAGLAATLEGDGRCGRNDTTNVLLELTAPACVLQADGACAAARLRQWCQGVLTWLSAADLQLGNVSVSSSVPMHA